MPFPKQEAMQRVRYSDDQLLKARDLDDDLAYEATLRRMHVRGLHETWGVALGFYLSLSSPPDKALVGPGLAYDALGRELLLSETLAMPAPQPQAGSKTLLAYDLALSQRGPADILARRRQMSVCADKVPAEGVSIRWVLVGEQSGPATGLLAKDLRLGLEVPLGRFVFDPVAGTLSGPVAGFRKNARPLLRPHIGTGAINFDAIGLTPNRPDATMTVATSDAGFSAPPQYFVFLPQNAVVNSFNSAGFVGPLLSVSQPLYDQFTLRATLAADGKTPPEERHGRLKALLGELSGSQVVWVGIEPVAGCQPTPDFTLLYYPFGAMLKPVAGMWALAMTPFGMEEEVA